MKLIVDESIVTAAVAGGAVLGGGGGGSPEKGLELGLKAVEQGRVIIIDPDDIDPATTIITVSSVGAPAAKNAVVTEDDYVHTIELMSKEVADPIGGLITNENGGAATVNGWFQSAVTGIPVIDAPCNGRAHPTGIMGSLGLHSDPGYRAVQVACGGNRDSNDYVELTAKGNLTATATLIRAAAVQAHGLVAVARNPVPVKLAVENGAPGAIKQAIKTGQSMLEQSNASGRAQACAASLNGTIVDHGRIIDVQLTTDKGFDHGTVRIDAGAEYLLTFWNEYMTVDKAGIPIATFPDLITTLSADTGMAVSTADIRPGMDVYLLYVDADELNLSVTMHDHELLSVVSPIIGKDILTRLKR